MIDLSQGGARDAGRVGRLGETFAGVRASLASDGLSCWSAAERHLGLIWMGLRPPGHSRAVPGSLPAFI